ncbi:MAG: FxsA family protein [Solirubrobacteraceae bacterium]
MFPLLLVLFIVIPIVEIFAIVTVGQAIGVWWTIALLIVDSILGAMLMRSQGRAAWRRFNEGIAEGRAPAREVLDGVLVIFGGALLLTPGFVTDVLGALFLIPPTRAVLRRVLVRRFAARMIVSAPPRFGARPPAHGDADVEGTASEVDPRALR